VRQRGQMGIDSPSEDMMHFDSVTSERRTLASGVAAAAEQAGCQDQTANGCRAATHEQSRAASVVPLAALHVCPGLRLTHHWASAIVSRMLHCPIPSGFTHDAGGTVPRLGLQARLPPPQRRCLSVLPSPRPGSRSPEAGERWL